MPPARAAAPSPESAARALVTKYAAAHQRLIAAARTWLRKRLPTAFEVVYEYNGFFVISYSPTERGYEGVVSLRGDADGVRLYFNRAAKLPDPDKLLQGSAKQVRWVALDSATALKQPAIASWMDAVLAANPVPFARTGGGAIVMSPSTVKRQRKR